MLNTKKINNNQLDKILNDFEILGYAKLTNFIDDETCNYLNKIVNSLYKKNKKKNLPDYSDKRPNDKQVFNLQNKDKIFIDLISCATIEKILIKIINDKYYTNIPSDKPNYILGELIARSSGDNLKYHMDSWLPSSGKKTWMVQLAIALDDRQIDEGCTMIVPGSHRSDNYTDRNFPSGTAVPLKKGDLAIWDSRIWHGALPKKSKKNAWAIIATMQMWWVKQRFDLPRGLPYDIFCLLSKKQKALIGYSSLPPINEFFSTDARQGYKSVEENKENLFLKLDES